MKVENDSRFHLTLTFPSAENAASTPLVASGPRPLSGVPLNQWYRIDRLDGPEQDCDRLLDLGFTPGEEIAVTHATPFGDPLVVRVRGALLALRKREAGWILVE